MSTNQQLLHPPSDSVEVVPDFPKDWVHCVSQEFSIDELREIAHHFGVPQLAQITEREMLVQSIRRRI